MMIKHIFIIDLLARRYDAYDEQSLKDTKLFFSLSFNLYPRTILAHIDV